MESASIIGIIVNFCLVELKMKDYFKTGCFASKWLIEIEAKGTNQRKISSLWVERSSNKRGDVFGWVCVICVAWEV